MLLITRVLIFILQSTLLINVTVAARQTNVGSHERFGQRFAMEPQDQTAIVGSRVTLPCRVVAKVGNIQWTKDSFGLGEHRNLSGYDRYSMVGSDEEGDFSLDIFPVMLDDDAKYQCQVGPAKRQQGLRSRFAKLTILVPPDNPKITQGSHILTTEDREIELECISKGGKPPAEITWIDGHGNVIQEGIEYMSQQMENSKLFEARSILKFTPKKDHHNTTISCQAQNTADRTYKSAKVKVDVKFAPKVIVSVVSNTLGNGRIPEGAEVRFACHAEANPNEVSFKWYINDEVIIGDQSTELIIPSINRTLHDSIVKCEVTNNVGKSEDSETLDISYAPVFRTRPQSVEADLGQTVVLSCEVDGNPTPEIVWIFAGHDRVVSTSSNLTVVVTEDTIGGYFCKATVPGYADIIEQATIYLKGFPTITSTRRQFGTLGESTQIECVAFSIPKARFVIWSYKGHDINNSSNEFQIQEDTLPFGVKSTLLIKRSELKHFGVYNCTVINEYGSDILDIELNLENKYNSQLFFVCFGAALSFIVLIILILIWLMCTKKTQKKLPPADVIPNDHHNYNGKCKESDCSSNKSDIKINRENEYLETCSAHDLCSTKIPLNTFGSSLSSALPDFRYSGDFTDSFGQLQTTKLGCNNNGYIPYVDYNRDYTPPPSLTLSNSLKPVLTSSSLSNHLVIGTSTATPTITSASIVGITTGSITNGTYSLTRNRPLERLLNNTLPNSTSSTLSNGLINQSLLNIDPRYSATYGNPYLKQHSQLIGPLNTANLAITPAPPPYSNSRGSNCNSSFSSTTTISNINGGGSIVGIGTTALTTCTNGQTTSSSGKFITSSTSPKVGSLATHV
ncbi:irregular chiasm C-roughest protein isoform X2 [Chironomus tepperi]|uniref:irregular chiasm C-roughest protein isoform X2 n=1 Tax=Chironomus tepperi TaxID=113505 RepID=UPI00391F71B6